MSWSIINSKIAGKDRLSVIDGRPAFAKGVERDDAALLRRIIDAYRRANAHPLPKGGMWQGIFEQKQLDIHATLMDGDVGAVADIFRNPGQNNLFFGIDPLCKVLQEGLSDPVNSESYASRCLDGVIRLCEAVGASRVYNIEAGGLPEFIGIEDRLTLLDEALGIRVAFPNPFADEFGIETSRGIVTWKSPDSIYQARRSTQLAAGGAMLEIGGGIGRVAYYSRAFGATAYTIVDLPLSNAIQAYFLGLTLGEDAVCLYGEDRPAFVRLIPPESFFDSDDTYAVIFNSNSITELGSDSIDRYWAHISRRTNVFLSMNHEANERRVWDIIGRSGERFPSWMRDGYVEEIVRFA